MPGTKISRMDKGIVLFGHNSKDIDYVTLADVSAGYAVKNLDVPVTLITDNFSVTNSESKLKNIDNLLIVDRPEITNTRQLAGSHIDFINTNRHLAFRYSPYERTLLIDSDLFLLSDRLSAYWNSDREFLITEGMIPLGSKLSKDTIKLSPTTINMRWATAIMFSKTDTVENIFKTVEYIKQNWFYFVDLYNLPASSFRNDYAFTIANHIVYGFTDENNFLPSPIMALEDFKVIQLRSDSVVLNDFIVDTDVHIMDKFSLQAAIYEQ